MPTVRLNAIQSCVIKAAQPTQNFSAGSTCHLTMPYASQSEHMLVSFEQPPANLRQKKIIKVDIYVYVAPIIDFGQPLLSPKYSAFVASSATFANDNEWNAFYKSYSRVWYTEPQYTYTEINTDYENVDAKHALKNGVNIGAVDGQRYDTHTTRGTYAPYAILHYDNASAYLDGLYPRGGYVAKHKEKTFSWYVGSNDLTFDEIKQSSAVFRWRTAEGETPTEINLTTENRITISAGTFTTDNFQWQVTATATNGETLTSNWFTMSTVEELSTAVPIEPIDVIADGTQKITFKWNHIISTGTAQTKFDLQTSADGVSFSDLHDETTSRQSYTAAANTFPAGNLYWRVRTYNTDNTAGQWSNTAKIVIRAAPPKPLVSVDASPRPIVSWEATGQQAYEVEFGNVKSGLKFGTEKTLRCPDYLPDGTHTARVRVQNQYGLWSEWGSADFSVTNVAGEPIMLSVASEHNAILSWNTVEQYSKYYIYRDGKLIAKTAEKTYTDNTSAGSVVYTIRGAYNASNNYGISNSAKAEIECETVMICDIVSGEWMELNKTSTSDRLNVVSDGVQARYIYFSGNEYPSVELSEFKSKKYTFETAFKDKFEADRFAKFIGKLVCVKDQWNNMVIGVLVGLNKSSGRFFQSFFCEVEQISYNEAVSHD